MQADSLPTEQWRKPVDASLDEDFILKTTITLCPSNLHDHKQDLSCVKQDLLSVLSNLKFFEDAKAIVLKNTLLLT